MPVLDPTNNATDRVRLMVGDTSDIQYLPDSVYQYELTKNNNDERTAAKTCAMYILGMLTSRTKERLDRIEIYGAEAFNNYLNFLKMLVDPRNSFDVATPYAGGISISDVDTNNANTDVVQNPAAKLGRDLDQDTRTFYF